MSAHRASLRASSFKTRIYLVIAEEEQIHPDIVRDDLAAILDAAGYEFSIEAEDGND